jgi:hypothetical protein
MCSVMVLTESLGALLLWHSLHLGLPIIQRDFSFLLLYITQQSALQQDLPQLCWKISPVLLEVSGSVSCPTSVSCPS